MRRLLSQSVLPLGANPYSKKVRKTSALRLLVHYDGFKAMCDEWIEFTDLNRVKLTNSIRKSALRERNTDSVGCVLGNIVWNVWLCESEGRNAWIA